MSGAPSDTNAMRPEPIMAQCQGFATTEGRRCRQRADGRDGVHCVVHQPGEPGSNKRNVNPSHRSLIRRAREAYKRRPQTEASVLVAKYGGSASWWSRVIVQGLDNPHFLRAVGVARLVRYLDDDGPVNGEGAALPDEGALDLTALAARWRESQAVPPAGALDKLDERLSMLEALMSEVLKSLTP